jgi:hypothetical protein
MRLRIFLLTYPSTYETVFLSNRAYQQGNEPMNTTTVKNEQARAYLNGLIRFSELRTDARVWLLANHPDACPRGAWLDFMAS